MKRTKRKYICTSSVDTKQRIDNIFSLIIAINSNYDFMNEHVYDVSTKLEGKFYYRYDKLNDDEAKQDIVERLVQAISLVPQAEGDYRLDGMQFDFDGSGEKEATPFMTVCEVLNSLYEAKNADYGNSFENQLDEDGLMVAKIRLSDKVGRFSKLLKSEAKVKEESITDTLMDLASYSIMTLMWMAKRG